ncbi:alpha/beta fold hydrolase [Longimicrobium terrae]|uniref:Alpha-beta hydrolase superfamily lysophospholipase n=1 Tax=Longimicrobium terrae TaxID=1639882 RepID=A0A841GN16_9BACT|nr:alpha-beta hydrolase superfamily lysophospholipase [Longimicrobium terrae]MBB6070201.1 alpha-beta hydrolase superfamily lysophospholipase [Longimicrobium terrae]NNC30707.1 alpha/beta hydrolase [Longimicrobium terrae]
MTVAERGEELRAADGVRLHLRSWPVPAPRAAVLVSHGLGEHGGRYAALAADLAERGIGVHAIDHRGHGLSGGARGHVNRFAEYVRDLEQARARVAAASSAPLFLLGHSLGGLIAIRHLQTHTEAPFRGAILSAPLLGVAVRAPRWKVAVSGLLSRIAPRIPFSNAVDPGELSAEEEYAAAYRADPLVHALITPRLYTEMMAAIRAAFADRDTVHLPMLVLAPEADRIVLPEAVARWAAACPGDVDVRRYPGFRHEPLNERDRHRAVADVAGWIDGRLA